MNIKSVKKCRTSVLVIESDTGTYLRVWHPSGPTWFGKLEHCWAPLEECPEAFSERKYQEYLARK